MNFRPKNHDKPDLNLIPMIDVLIILLIFLVLTTTFSREANLKINLPKAQTQSTGEQKGIAISINAEGKISINQTPIDNAHIETLKKALIDAAHGNKEPLLVLSADQKTTHQTVMNVLDAANQLGFSRISFVTQAENKP